MERYIVATIALIAAVLVVGCNGSGTTYESTDINGTEAIKIPAESNVSISDITSTNNVESVTVNEGGLLLLCMEGSTCNATVDESQDNDIITTDVNNTDSHDVDNSNQDNPVSTTTYETNSTGE